MSGDLNPLHADPAFASSVGVRAGPNSAWLGDLWLLGEGVDQRAR
ncbi:MAG: hypothetical protein U0165_05100 [Polyangiaceae bacterium]